MALPPSSTTILMSISVFFLHLVFLVDASNFTVYRLTPGNKEQLEYINDLYLNNVKFDFWKEPSRVGEQVHVMLKDSLVDRFISEMDRHNITYSLMIENVENKILKQKEKAEKMKEFNWLRDSTRNRINFNLAQYHSFAEIIHYMNALAVTYPEIVQVMPIGTTHEGRQIPLIKIGRNTGYTKPAIWVDGGIHAREWVAPSVVLYMMDQLTSKYDVDASVRSYVDGLDWFIVPLLNPDGYEYSRSSTDPEVRLWRKNRSPKVCTQTRAGPFIQPQLQCCQGVDLNRNFDWHFGVEGSSTDPCSEIYQGAYAFSEPETRAVRDFLSPRRGQLKTFLTFHSYSQILMYPFGHQVRTYSQDVNDLRSTAMQAAGALRSLYGTNYVVGTGADTLYPASGGSEDWAKGRMGVKYSYLFELRPEEQVWDGFLLAENLILPTARETWEAVKVIASHTLSQAAQQSVAQRDTTTEYNARRKNWYYRRGRKHSKACVDKDSLCPYWAQNGACSNWPTMAERCPRSCGVCDISSSS